MGHVFVARGDLRTFVRHAYLPLVNDDGPGLGKEWLTTLMVAPAFEDRGEA